MQKYEEWMDFNGKFSLEKNDRSGRKGEKQMNFFAFPTQLPLDTLFLWLTDVYASLCF